MHSSCVFIELLQRSFQISKFKTIIMDLNKFEIYEPTYSEENKGDVLKEIQEREKHLKELNIYGSPDSDLLRVIENASSSLMTLKLRNLNNGIKASDFDFISNCNQLKCFHLQFNSINSRSAKEINQILKNSTLEELYLSFRAENLEEICFPSTLKRLYFQSDVACSNIEHIMNISDCCPDLEKLIFFNVILNEEDFEFLEYLGEECPNITSLYLLFNMETSINFSFLRKFPNLKNFVLEYHGSTIDPSDLFSMIPQIEGLIFDLPNGFSSKPDFSKLPHLKAIGFNSNQIGNTIINNIKDLQTLETLKLYSNSLDFFCEILPLLPNLTCVQLPNVKYDYAVYARMKLLNKKRKNKLEVQLIINDDVIVSNYTTDNFIVKKIKPLLG